MSHSGVKLQVDRNLEEISNTTLTIEISNEKYQERHDSKKLNLISRCFKANVVNIKLLIYVFHCYGCILTFSSALTC